MLGWWPLTNERKKSPSVKRSSEKRSTFTFFFIFLIISLRFLRKIIILSRKKTKVIPKRIDLVSGKILKVENINIVYVIKRVPSVFEKPYPKSTNFLNSLKDRGKLITPKEKRTIHHEITYPKSSIILITT
jgi:hypothetical protein